jgi:signal peptidase I
MHPTIRPGEYITVKPVEPSGLGLADIVLYRAGQGILAHRVVGRRRGGGGMRAFIVRGDASENCDDPVGPAQSLGKVVLVERAGRRIALGTPRVKFFHLARLSLHRIRRRVDRISL